MKACERCGAFGPNLKFFDRFAGGVENEDANFLDCVRSCQRCTPRAQTKYVRRRVVAVSENHASDSYWMRTLNTALLSCGHVRPVGDGDKFFGGVVPCGRCTNAR